MDYRESLQRAQREVVQLAPWNPQWVQRFRRELDRLETSLPGRFMSIEHIGSTAIEGLDATPVVDILGSVASMAEADALLDDLCARGYTASIEANPTLTDRRCLMRHANGHRTHHLHLVVFNSEAWRSLIVFRDALRSDVMLRQRYADLKQQLAAQWSGDREAYAQAKQPFITHTLRRAGLRVAEPPVPVPQPPVHQPPADATGADLSRAAQVAEQAAYSAGTHLLASRSRLAALVFTREDPESVVRQIRRETEQLIKDILTKRFASHGFLGEAHPGQVDNDAPRWEVDALDGAASYLRDHARFAVSIALVVEGVPQIGVVYDPCRNEFFGAIHGRGAVLNGTPIRCARTDDPAKALAATLFPEPSSIRSMRHGPELAHALRRFRGVRRAGSAALEMAYLAAGRIDAFWGHDLSARSTAAGIVLARESGAHVDLPDTQPLLPSHSLAACAPGLRDTLIKLLKPR